MSEMLMPESCLDNSSMTSRARVMAGTKYCWAMLHMLTQSGHGDYDFETRFNTCVAASRPAPTWLNFLSNAYATGPAAGLQSHLVEPIRSRQDRSGADGTGRRN